MTEDEKRDYVTALVTTAVEGIDADLIERMAMDLGPGRHLTDEEIDEVDRELCEMTVTIRFADGHVEVCPLNDDVDEDGE